MKIIEHRNIWIIISLLVIGMGFATMVSRSYENQPILNYGVDFTGGSSFILRFDSFESDPSSNSAQEDQEIQFIETLRDALTVYGMEKSHIQISNHSEIIIRTSELDESGRRDLLAHLESTIGPLELLEASIIGPSIGDELKEQSFWIIFLVSLTLLVYVSIRFDWVYGVSALVALLHDALVLISLAALLKIEINTTFVAAILTILGYSINDTIIIFDRIRENLREINHEVKSFEIMQCINQSIRQTLSRTLHTSLTTLVVISSLLFFGGMTIKSFALVLFMGIIIGTYSSIFIASPILYHLGYSNDSKKGRLKNQKLGNTIEET